MAELLTRDALQDRGVDEIARALLGVELHSFHDGGLTIGRIVETEAYRGADDRAAHSFNHRHTPRTEVFFGPAGHAYIYFIYGIHTMFNIVVGPQGRPDAVLVRAIEPLVGQEIMRERRSSKSASQVKLEDARLGNGPGLVCQALGITREDYGLDLLDSTSPLRLVGSLGTLTDEQIVASPRVGVAYAEECAAWPWRFRESGSAFTSPAK